MAKIGEGSLAAMGRLGLKELRNAFNPSRESVADSELGMYGTATQGEIAEARSDEPGVPNEQTLTTQDLRSGAQQAKEREQNSDGPDKSRDMER
jgi:hypothetical protein